MSNKATENYEYSSVVELKDASKIYFAIPSSIILDKEIGDKRVAIFSFFSTYRGIMNQMFFSINAIAKWLGKQPNRCPSGINAKIIDNINHLRDGGYLELLSDDEGTKNSVCMEATFNLSKVSQDCEQDRFATVYVDELNQILNYRNSSSKDNYLQNDTLLLVFAYLRMKIPRRRNRLFPDEINLNGENNITYDIESRRSRYPEVYDDHYKKIGEILNISPRTVSKAVAVLNEFGLIYSEALPRVKISEKNSTKWLTEPMLFCNAYKREGTYLLSSGKEYYQTEIKNKKKKLDTLGLKLL